MTDLSLSMSPETSTIISIHQLTVGHIGHTILKDLSLALYPGDHLAVIGPAGSGKTTLLKAITGKIFYQGEIRIDPMIKRQMVMIDQQHHFTNRSNTNDLYYQQRYNSADAEDTLTVSETLGTDSRESERVLQLMNIEYLRDKPLIQLSNGENKKLQIAQALLRNPSLLIIDQPFVGLDVDTRVYMHSLFDRLSKHMNLILVTTSDEIPGCINSVLTLSPGGPSTYGPKNDFLKGMPERAKTRTKEHEVLKTLVLRDPAVSVPDPIIDMTKVTVRYGDHIILQDIDWKVHRGERWVLSGPNGAGKSTMLSLLTGDNPQAYSNQIILFGQRRGSGESIWELKKKIGYFSPELCVFFDPDSTCFGAVASGLYDTIGLFKKLEDHEKALVNDWLVATNLKHLSVKKWYELSISEQRKTLLVRAMIKNAPLLILDEPLQGLDPEQSRDLIDMINIVCRYGQRTLIYVTHYAGVVPEGIDHVLKIKSGKIIENTSVDKPKV